ncbi:hypothetical protein TrCOL_g8739 [Triparma columacea]|uniref:Uncharacterized protein n=1 Tax=Triparma columacea TaxID=722753 RepID=A0A9W7GJE9_9STRA|nr:hypothetical protein TrCOL_g8739 [Triparma columacea]
MSSLTNTQTTKPCTIADIPIESHILPFLHYPSIANLKATSTLFWDSINKFEKRSRLFLSAYDLDKVKSLHDYIHRSSPPDNNVGTQHPNLIDPSFLFKFMNLIVASGALPYVSSLPLNPLKPTILASAIFAALIDPTLRPKVTPYIIRAVGLRLEYSQFGTLQNGGNGFRGRDIPHVLELTEGEVWQGLRGQNASTTDKAKEMKRICCLTQPMNVRPPRLLYVIDT